MFLVVVLALLIAGAVAYSIHQQNQQDADREREVDEATCDLLVRTGSYSSMDDCMDNR